MGVRMKSNQVSPAITRKREREEFRTAERGNKNDYVIRIERSQIK